MLSYIYILGASVLAYLWYHSNAEKSTGPAFVMFYSPHCGYCHEAMPEFKRLGQSYVANGQNINIIAIDAETHRDLAEKAGVKGYPTFVYTNGPISKIYEGPRKAADFRAFLAAQTR